LIIWVLDHTLNTDHIYGNATDSMGIIKNRKTRKTFKYTTEVPYLYNHMKDRPQAARKASVMRCGPVLMTV
jgi:hypothetical protein